MKRVKQITTKCAVAVFALTVIGEFAILPVREVAAQSGGGWAVYANCRAPFNGVQCTIGVADAYYARHGSARAKEGWTRISNVYRTGAEAWGIACKQHYAANAYQSPDIAYNRVSC